MPYSFVDLLLYFFIYSFCGWLMETVLCSVRERRFVNRGFLNGPLCPIYGCAILLVLIFLIPVRDEVTPLATALPVIYLTGAALATAVEYVTSWAMEKLFHARWWDYSQIRFNLNGRVCLSISLTWGALATGFLYLVQPFFERLLARLYAAGAFVPAIAASVLSALLLADIVLSVRVAARIGNKLEQLDKWSEFIREHIESLELPSKEAVVGKMEDAYEKFAAYSERLREKLPETLGFPMPEWSELSLEALRRQIGDYAGELRKKLDALVADIRPLQRRMLRAFPNIRRTGASLTLRELQQRLFGRKEKGKNKNSRKP